MRMYSSSDSVPLLSGSCRAIIDCSTGGSSRKPAQARAGGGVAAARSRTPHTTTHRISTYAATAHACMHACMDRYASLRSREGREGMSHSGSAAGAHTPTHTRGGGGLRQHPVVQRTLVACKHAGGVQAAAGVLWCNWGTFAAHLSPPLQAGALHGDKDMLGVRTHTQHVCGRGGWLAESPPPSGAGDPPRPVVHGRGATTGGGAALTCMLQRLLHFVRLERPAAVLVKVRKAALDVHQEFVQALELREAQLAPAPRVERAACRGRAHRTAHVRGRGEGSRRVRADGWCEQHANAMCLAHGASSWPLIGPPNGSFKWDVGLGGCLPMHMGSPSCLGLA